MKATKLIKLLYVQVLIGLALGITVGAYAGKFNAERLLLSTGITNHYMDSNWQNGVYSAVGRRIETPFMNMRYHSTHGPLFETSPRPPNTPYIRVFES